MNYKVYNDYELISMIREKDDNSYDVLFHKYMPIIKRIALDYYQKFSTYGYDLDDFIQEGYLAFQKALLNYNETKEVLFYTFIVFCLHRRFLSFCKTISNGNKCISNQYVYPIDDISISTGIDYADDYVSQMEIFHTIWNIVYTYSFEDICVFELRWNHFRYGEIAKLLDIPLKRCQVKIHRMMSDIRKHVQNAL